MILLIQKKFSSDLSIIVIMKNNLYWIKDKDITSLQLIKNQRTNLKLNRKRISNRALLKYNVIYL